MFEEQIKRGGPVTVTHPKMMRYFMAASEAVLLVLEAEAIGQGGEVFVLDMGEPVKIVDLARKMITLSGKEPDVDIPLVFTGMRPGEKLFEEILSAEEGTIGTKYDKIYIAKSSRIVDANILGQIEKLIELGLGNGGEQRIKKLLKEIIPSYSCRRKESLRKERSKILCDLNGEQSMENLSKKLGKKIM